MHGTDSSGDTAVNTVQRFGAFVQSPCVKTQSGIVHLQPADFSNHPHSRTGSQQQPYPLLLYSHK